MSTRLGMGTILGMGTCGQPRRGHLHVGIALLTCVTTSLHAACLGAGVLVWACVGQADSGNCKVRLVDFHTGNVVTRWGSACLAAGARSDVSRYIDSPVSDRNTLGSHLALAWVSWYPPPPPTSFPTNLAPESAHRERESIIGMVCLMVCDVRGMVCLLVCDVRGMVCLMCVGFEALSSYAR
jgi:hypothetical protein